MLLVRPYVAIVARGAVKHASHSTYEPLLPDTLLMIHGVKCSNRVPTQANKIRQDALLFMHGPDALVRLFPVLKLVYGFGRKHLQGRCIRARQKAGLLLPLDPTAIDEHFIWSLPCART